MANVTDPIADFLTRIRNAQMANHRTVEIPASNLKKKLTEILYEQGFIFKYTFQDTSNKQGAILIALKYDKDTKLPVIQSLTRVSKPGLRKFSKASDIPRVKSGLGISIVSTSQGIMTDKKCRELNIGGEIMCNIY
jgi:small subunit ribosomal protein S8